MSSPVTRNLHPLPFESLDPKRFEDLIRQLAYDFRIWRQIEATGRSGSDEGYDARAFEIVLGADHDTLSRDTDVDDEDTASGPEAPDRVWLIQCKRERAIGPTKIIGHLEAIPSESFRGIYGLIFAAACDFSKATRDACRNWCRERGLQEIHIWGKAEIEDQLYQPKNDNLLFAYFGISLQMRRQTQATKLRRTTTLKRTIKRHLSEGGWLGQTILIRDPSDDRYPYTDGKTLKEGQFLWAPYYCNGVGVHGLRVTVRCFHGYVKHETGEWDFASALNRAIPYELDNLWSIGSKEIQDSHGLIERWSELPRGNQCFIVMETWLPFDEIIEIDEIGDDYLEVPTVFCRFRDGKPPFTSLGRVHWEQGASGYRMPMDWNRDRHIRVFDERFRDTEFDASFASSSGIKFATELSPFPVSEEVNCVAADIDP